MSLSGWTRQLTLPFQAPRLGTIVPPASYQTAPSPTPLIEVPLLPITSVTPECWGSLTSKETVVAPPPNAHWPGNVFGSDTFLVMAATSPWIAAHTLASVLLPSPRPAVLVGSPAALVA